MEFTGERFVLGKADGEIETEHLHRYNAVLELASGKNVLDIACGEGFGTAILARKAASVWGVDISDEAIAYARQKYEKYNLKYKQGSVESLDFDDDLFDMIVSFETIEHVEELVQDKFLKEASRVLKKNGILVISTPDKYLYTDLPNHRNPYHIKEFYYSEYKDFLEKNFKYVDFYNQNVGNYGLIVKRNDKLREGIKLINGEDSLKEGRFIIAICSNEEISKDISINSIYENKTKKEVVVSDEDDFLQLYWEDESKGFTESNSIKAKCKYSGDFQTLCFTIPSHSNGKIRLDLGNKPGSIQLKKEMIFKNGDGVSLNKICISNSLGLVQLQDNNETMGFISMSNDPQLLLENSIEESEGNTSIYIDVKIRDFDYGVCLDEINSYLLNLRGSSDQSDEIHHAENPTMD